MNGDIVWEWVLSEHFDEFNFSEEAKNIMFRDPNFRDAGGGMGDWMPIFNAGLKLQKTACVEKGSSTLGGICRVYLNG